MNLTPILIAIAAGIFIELFFRVIRYRDASNTRGPVPKYTPYDHYLSVAEFVAGGSRRWKSYVMFRTIPPLVVFLLLASINKRYFPAEPLWPFLAIAALVSLAPRDLWKLIRRGTLLPERLVHTLNIIVVFIALALIVAIARWVPLADLAPSISGIADNIWSSLFVAVLVVFYLDATNRNPIPDDDERGEVQRINYVVNSYNEIKNHYGATIDQACTTHQCSRALLYAVLIYENMNRPPWMRYLENLIVRSLHRELTVGIAQVRSKRPLTDEASIAAGARILASTRQTVKTAFSTYPAQETQLKPALIAYNPDDDYVDSVLSILSVLHRYAVQEF
jgi:hypothetical protein